MKFGHLELPVADPQASLAFYRDKLGFKLVADQGGRFIWMEKGGLEILLLPKDAQPSPCPVFYTPELPAAVQQLEDEGVAFEHKGNCYHFKDPDGHEFQLVDPNDDHSGE